MAEYAKTQVFTTGQISKICQVAPRTVSKWFDNGTLKGYRIPGSNDRRVPRNNFVSFLNAHGMPADAVVGSQTIRLLSVGLDLSLREELRRLLPVGEVEMQSVESVFEAGARVVGWEPNCVLVDVRIGKEGAESMARTIHSLTGQRAPKLVAILPERGSKLVVDEALFQERFHEPFDMVLLSERLRGLGQQQMQARG